MNLRNILVLAQKEFADDLWSLKFQVMLVTLLIIVFFNSCFVSYRANSDLIGTYMDIAQVISLFMPFMGIVIGFDLIGEERESGSLNVLLSHPLFRDTVVAGKTLGAMMTLGLLVLITIITVTGTMILLTGEDVTYSILLRIFIFGSLTFAYLAVFTSLGIFSSIVIKDGTRALVYDIILCIVLCITFGMIISTAASIITGEKPLDLGENDQFFTVNAALQKYTPSYYYAMPVSGKPGFSWLGISSEKPEIKGLFDMNFTLSQWWNEFRSEIFLQFAISVLLIIASFITFLRQDIVKSRG